MCSPRVLVLYGGIIDTFNAVAGDEGANAWHHCLSHKGTLPAPVQQRREAMRQPIGFNNGTCPEKSLGRPPSNKALIPKGTVRKPRLEPEEQVRGTQLECVLR